MFRYKSNPCLILNSVNSSKSIIDHSYLSSRDDLKDRFYDLQDQHLELRREANKAQDQIKTLNTRLSRLLAEKKRFYRNARSEREIMMEEKIFDLESLIYKLRTQNDRLRERLELLQQKQSRETTNRRPLSSSISRTTTQTTSHRQHRASSSALIGVRSKTDSGLGSYFRPLNLRYPSQTSILSQSRKQIDSKLQDRSVRFRDLQEIKNSNVQNDIEESDRISSITATALQEARDEIIRLEMIIEQQQDLIDRLGLKPLIEEDYLKSSMSFATVTTTTTTSNLTTTKPNRNQNLRDDKMNGDDIQVGFFEFNRKNGDEHDENIDSLWHRYQNIMIHREAFRNVSMECRQIIERLYADLQSEQIRCEELRKKLNTIPYYSSVINEKEKAIELLDKENQILKQSMQQCIDQCLMTVSKNNGNNPKRSETDSNVLNEMKTIWEQNRQQYENQIDGLSRNLSRLNDDLDRQQNLYESLRSQYSLLQEINENDQLKIDHLEDKIKRLSEIFLFNDDEEKRVQNTVSSVVDSAIKSYEFNCEDRNDDRYNSRDYLDIEKSERNSISKSKAENLNNVVALEYDEVHRNGNFSSSDLDQTSINATSDTNTDSD
ncbi:hypothetical protein NH340_JMT08486 [Sarcoptes scabiei]|nr:hypothetical protein NH340_JMT08486 [Sarcoptes scabiei]